MDQHKVMNTQQGNQSCVDLTTRTYARTLTHTHIPAHIDVSF